MTTKSKDQLHELVLMYDQNKDEKSLENLNAFLKKHTIYFSKYYTDTEGAKKVETMRFRESGTFICFTDSIQFHKPSLLTVKTQNNEVVYVSLNEFELE